jgi:acyl-CoA dehydrogenase
VPEQTYLNWPFLEDSHRALARDFRTWADSEIAPLAEEEPSDEAGLDALARELVSRLADGGWLRYSVPAPWGGIYETLDVRALCLMRETLAQYSGMADFSFVPVRVQRDPQQIPAGRRRRQTYRRVCPVRA